MKHSHSLRVAAFCAVAALMWICDEVVIEAADFHRVTLQRVMPAEFEKTRAVLLCWEEKDKAIQRLQLQIIAAISKQSQILLLVRSGREHQQVVRTAQIMGIALAAVTIRKAPFNTIWARDYGPLFIRSPSRLNASRNVPANVRRASTPAHNYEAIDTEYRDPGRADDDAVPDAIGRMNGTAVRQLPICLQGGNLLSNGAGLYLTSRKTLSENAMFNRKKPDVIRILKTALGATKLIFLEELVGEPNGHVDMFATFSSVNTVVVGEYSPKDDAVNAAILNRNAAELAAVRTRFGPLRVVRIPMPKRTSDEWPTYTNVLRANGVLLMPVYPGLDSVVEAKARGVYQKLLPNVKIVGIDCRTVIESGGAVHCMTMNMPIPPPFARLAVPPARPLPRAIAARALQIPLCNQRRPLFVAGPKGRVRRDPCSPFFTAAIRFLSSAQQYLWFHEPRRRGVERESSFDLTIRRNVRFVTQELRVGVRVGIKLLREERAPWDAGPARRTSLGADPTEALRAFGDEYEVDSDSSSR